MRSTIVFMRMMLVVAAAAILAVALWAASLPNCTGTTVTGCIMTRQSWPNAYGGPYDLYTQAVPTSLTVVDAKTSHILGYCVSNTTGSALTFTLQTGDATPLQLPVSGSIPASTQVCNNTDWGLLSNGGFSIQASGSGLLITASWRH
jgi:hypothetical protein